LCTLFFSRFAALSLGPVFEDLDSEYHLWFLDASGPLRVAAVEMVEWVEAAREVALEDALEDELEELLNILDGGAWSLFVLERILVV
jgi:hypothetical protein